MTVSQLSKDCGFEILNLAEDREITCIYCCDLLSIAMGRAPADSAWCTVMGNLNAVAVASLADAACIILCEGMPMDEAGLAKAREQDINLLCTDKPIFEAACAVKALL